MKKNVIISYILITILSVALGSCINSNPSGGAAEFLDEFCKYSQAKDFESAEKLMNKYFDAYNEEDKKTFFMRLSILLDKSEFDNEQHFIVIGATQKEIPIFREYAIAILAWRMAIDNALQNDKSPNACLGE